MPSVRVKATTEAQAGVVIVGGLGAMGSMMARKLEKKGVAVTIIDVRESAVWNLGMPRALARGAGEFALNNKAADRLVPQGKVLWGRAVDVTAAEVLLEDGTQVPYSTLVLNTGSSICSIQELPTTGNLSTNQMTAYYESNNQAIQSADKLVVVGGGAVGIELMGELAHHFPLKQFTLLVGSQVLPGASKAVADKCLKWLQEHGVVVKLGTRVDFEKCPQLNGRLVVAEKTTVVTQDGMEIQADMVFLATGAKVNNALMRNSSLLSGKLNDKGEVVVNRHGQVEGLSNVFAIGQCAAVQEGSIKANLSMLLPIWLANIMAVQQGKQPTKVIKPNYDISPTTLGPKDGAGLPGCIVAQLKGDGHKFRKMAWEPNFK